MFHTRITADVRTLPIWRRTFARLVLALLVLLTAYGVLLAVDAQTPPAAGPIDRGDTDLALYQAVAARVGEGESYYSAAVAEQRTRDYPLRPIVTVRLPTLAWTVGTLGGDLAAQLLRLLMIAAVAAFALRLRKIAPSKPLWAVATFLATAGMTLLTVPAMTFWHESWSALLLALSLACRSRNRWGASLCLGLAAVLFRELALPYLAVMAVLAWCEGSRKEAAAWAAAILIFVAVLAAHATALSAYVTDADAASAGWSSAGGWPFILAMAQRCTLFAFLPPGVIAALVPLALLGWARLGGGTGERAFLLLLGYVAAFMLIGRPDNFYWGFMIAPLLPIGLAFAPLALRDLLRAATVPRT